jgi:hypothetical protein
LALAIYPDIDIAEPVQAEPLAYVRLVLRFPLPPQVEMPSAALAKPAE